MKRAILFASCAAVLAAFWAGMATASDPKPVISSEPAFMRALAKAKPGEQVFIEAGAGKTLYGTFVDYTRNEIVVKSACTGPCDMTVPLDKVLALTIVNR